MEVHTLPIIYIFFKFCRAPKRGGLGIVPPPLFFFSLSYNIFRESYDWKSYIMFILKYLMSGVSLATGSLYFLIKHRIIYLIIFWAILFTIKYMNRQARFLQIIVILEIFRLITLRIFLLGLCFGKFRMYLYYMILVFVVGEAVARLSVIITISRKPRVEISLVKF